MDINEIKELKSKFNNLADKHINLIKEYNLVKRELEQLKSMDSSSIVPPNKGKKAVLLVGADVSGSMGRWEREMGLKMTVSIETALSLSYDSVEVRLFHHHTQSVEVDKKEFLTKNVSGGTIASSVYSHMNKEIEDYNYENENVDVYVIHISDGDNLTSDNTRVLNIINRILPKVKMINYIEVNQYKRESTLLPSLRNISNSKFSHCTLQNSLELDSLMHRVCNRLFSESL
ncbi:DUF444 family protein [Alkalihalophilus pseudofirmus]|uniref:DUF444 family protein n=1 Tax=Alkalihalophilus pseudofirmus TaxID=79885 RepID=UPI00259BD830|nr:DUF444 family protein [Alkalihalophilus pseudofirmus]WEG18673.1 DUF444 family protein [Alkalihalophilus pseudofirmus]